VSDPAQRAAKLSRIPGVTIAEARARFGVTRAAIQKARKDPATAPSLAELALAALTSNGTVTAGVLGDLHSIAGWIDYINHDACTVEEVRALLAACVASGVLELSGETWKLRGAWP
jgi:hypothetical protein